MEIIPLRVSKGYNQFIKLVKSYNANNVSWTWPRMRGHKGHMKVNIKLIWGTGHLSYWNGEHPCGDLKGSKHSLKSYLANNVSLNWPSLKGPHRL